MDYDSHLTSTNLCPQGSSRQVGGGTRPSQKASGSPKGEADAPAASRTMGTGLRSQSLRGPRPSYGKLQEPWGRPTEGRLRRALSLRQGREKSRSSDGGPERLDTLGQEWLPGSLGDTEQLIQAEQEGSQRWLRQYQQVWLRAGGWRGTTGKGQDPKQRDPGEQRLRGRNGWGYRPRRQRAVGAAAAERGIPEGPEGIWDLSRGHWGVREGFGADG